MILYFADRQMNILGQASTSLPKGFIISDDNKLEDVDSGVATFSCYINFKKGAQLECEQLAEVGNYLLRSDGNEKEFYTIIDSEVDTKNQTVYIYAEDAGLDLINEVVGAFEAAVEQPLDWYINQFAADSGFEIGINEAEGLTRKLVWSGEQTVTERLAELVSEFGGYEVSYSFEIDGMRIKHKYINIHKQRGKDTGEQLRLNRDIDRIVTSKTISNLATALEVEGGVPEDAEDSITLEGYSYDDGDFFVDGTKLKSRNAVAKWSRYLSENKLAEHAGHIVKPFSSEATTQATLCLEAIERLKEICDVEINFEIDLKKLPDNVSIGDRINIIDDNGELYVSTRILKLEKSVANNEHSATLGEHLIKTSGISQKVSDLAVQFAANSQKAERALTIATSAKTNADEAKEQANKVLDEAEKATQSANNAATAANNATQAANEAKTAANNAEVAVNKVEESVTSLETTVKNAQDAVSNAQSAAENAEQKAEEATQAAQNAQTEATEAKAAAGNAQTAANDATTNAAAAKKAAEITIDNAEDAIETAEAAKRDAEQAERDIATFEENLETVESTIKADYARKTDLTESEAHLQSQIARNAAGITSTVSKLQTIDETANDAREKATAARLAATQAQTEANTAQVNADAAQTAANEATQAAANARAEAEAAQAAADNARNVLATAKADLIAAEIDLATVQARVDATEEEIEAAQAAVNTAQATVNQATTDVEAAIATATEAQNIAAESVQAAKEAQRTADEAVYQAELAQKLADQLSYNATEAETAATNAENTAAQAKSEAETAQTVANEAQETANNAVVIAEAAQAEADSAKEAALTAQAELENCNAELTQAEAYLTQAQADLVAIQNKADATAEEIEAAQAVVDSAQANVILAQDAADIALTVANEAEQAAENAKTEAKMAQQAADEAQAAATTARQKADEAQAVVDGLEIRITKTETQLKQTNEQISGSVTALEKKLIEVNGELQEQLNTITKYFTFDINGLTVGQIDSPCKVVIDNDDIRIIVNNEAVQAFDAEGNALIPALKVTKSLNILGYIISEDENGNVNCEYENTGGVE